MNVRCPSCQSLYRVDPARVPDAGVRTRCSSCQGVFRLERDGSATLGTPSAAAVTGAPVSTPSAPESSPMASPVVTPPVELPTRSEPVPMATPAAPLPATRSPAPEPTAASPAQTSEATQETPTPAAPAPVERPAAAATPPAPVAPAAAAPAGARPKPVFGQQDPDTRAQRIARALVSDMVVYNGDRRDQSLAAGSLKGDFREEILKSWEEYVEQVGQEMAKKTPHFRDALNSILAKGQQVF